jgi:endonuclease/exonuclease/phosphatase family metal-dependent hydrolase
MKNLLYIMIASLSTFLIACGDVDNCKVDTCIETNALIVNSGYKEVAIPDIKNDTYQVYVYKGGYNGNSISLNLSLADSLLTKYNTAKGTSYELLPSTYYTIGNGVSLNNSNYRDSIAITFNTAAMTADGIGSNYVLPLKLVSTDAQSVSSSNDSIFIRILKANTTSNTTSLQKYATTGEIKIMSFNVRYVTTEADAANNWDNRKIAWISMINDQRPAIIGVQEAVYSSEWAFLKNQLASTYAGIGVGRDDGASSGETMGILYKTSEISLINSGTFWLSDTPDYPSKSFTSGLHRSATWGIFQIKSSGQYFCYINTHLDLTASVRTSEMALIMKKFAEYNPNGYPQFFTADCNTTSDDAIFKDMKKTMKVARDEAPVTDYHTTYNGWGSGTGLLDNIFYTNTMTAIEYHTVLDTYNSVKYISDHYPIYAIIKY